MSRNDRGRFNGAAAASLAGRSGKAAKDARSQTIYQRADTYLASRLEIILDIQKEKEQERKQR